MYINKVVAEIEREVEGMYGASFFPKATTLRETTERYLAAHSGEQAIDYVQKGLERVGWKVTKIRCRDIPLHDIRDSCDHITD